jgi:hypothetical protein
MLRAATVLSLLLALSPRAALAAGTPTGKVSLELVRGSGTEQCIAETALVEGVEARLARPVFSRDARAPLRIQLVFSRPSARSWVAEIALESATGAPLGKRRLVTAAAHCSSLDDSLELVIALLVDAPLSEAEAHGPPADLPPPSSPSPAAASSSPPASSPPSVASAASRPPPSLVHVPTTTYAPREPWRFESSLGGTLALGLLPAALFGVELGLAGKAPHGPELRLFGGAYEEREVHAGPDSGARLTFMHLGLEACPLEGWLGGLRWSACGGQSVGRLRVAAFGYDQSESASQLTFALLARGVVLVPIVGRFSARFAGRAELPLARSSFYYGARDGAEPEVFRLRPLAGVFEAGLVVTL